MTNKRKIINDPVYGFLSIDDDLIYDVIEHPYFQRQRAIKQLGFTYLVYPGAMHSRFSHMLGALNLMKRAIAVLRTKGVSISDDESLGVQLAILLHDVGHGPFSHTSEKVLCNVHHEYLTGLFMRRLNAEFGGRLQTAIEIFDDTYPRHFLHQLVSSQLDMDRLDYLARDSFFTGVSEGIVGTERIINMLNVKDDVLVVDEKGIYSIEKFIISRRLMYWQVYLHKTVIAADNVFYSILSRARHLLSQGVKLDGYAPLLTFLERQYDASDFTDDRAFVSQVTAHSSQFSVLSSPFSAPRSPFSVLRSPFSASHLLDLYASIDDADVMSTVKVWQHSPDRVLSTLSRMLLWRRLPKVEERTVSFGADEVKRHIEQLMEFSEDGGLVSQVTGHRSQEWKMTSDEAQYFVGTGSLVNRSYSFSDSEIRILYKDGSCRGISESSDQLDRHFLEKAVKKYYIFYPKKL